MFNIYASRPLPEQMCSIYKRRALTPTKTSSPATTFQHASSAPAAVTATRALPFHSCLWWDHTDGRVCPPCCCISTAEAGRAFPKEGQATTSTSKQGGRTSFGHKHSHGFRCHLKTNHQWWQAREKIFFSETTLIQAFVLKLWSAFLGESCQPMREGRHHARTRGAQYVHRQASLLPCQSLGRALPSSYHSFGYEVPGGLSSKITAVTFSCF